MRAASFEAARLLHGKRAVLCVYVVCAIWDRGFVWVRGCEILLDGTLQWALWGTMVPVTF
jgi:hypothetical protein